MCVCVCGGVAASRPPTHPAPPTKRSIWESLLTLPQEIGEPGQVCACASGAGGGNLSPLPSNFAKRVPRPRSELPKKVPRRWSSRGVGLEKRSKAGTAQPPGLAKSSANGRPPFGKREPALRLAGLLILKRRCAKHQGSRCNFSRPSSFPP